MAANGGVLVEIPGPDGPAKADALAENLEERWEAELAYPRPMRFGELRVTGIDLSVGPEELARALAGFFGHCELELLKLGPFRRTLRGKQYGSAAH